MRDAGVESFPYFLGIHSLEQIARPDDRVCVLNILGGESRQVTPVSHAYSGGNVVFGTSPGRAGQTLNTPGGAIPVYNNVREGLGAGHAFNVGVVYLPPPAVRDGVAELIRINDALEKIIVITEKVSIHDAREIRAMAQASGIDVFGGNSLGVADAWNGVRIGGALGGDKPEEALIKGSVALFSNSGSFTTTIAQYLATAGWGTTTLISSGKDVYIHYAARDFAFALGNDSRSKAAVLYVEPGGYYEKDIDWSKPVVACVVGRWKSKLTRAVGHAGAMAGSGDAAEDKERWFMEAFGVKGTFTPKTPFATSRGAVVTNIADIPSALTTVMSLNGEQSDFAPRGNLSLKPWFVNDQSLSLPLGLSMPAVRALEPYDTQIEAIGAQIGAVFPREGMKDKSGATFMDPETQVTSLHGHSVLHLAKVPIEAQLVLPFLRETVGENGQALVSAAILSEACLAGTPSLAAIEACREAGNAPNGLMAIAAMLCGPSSARVALASARSLIDRFAHSGLQSGDDTSFDYSTVASCPAPFRAQSRDPEAETLLASVRTRGSASVFLDYLESLGVPLSKGAVLAGIALTLAWGPLTRKRISRLTAENLPWYLGLYGAMIGATIPSERHASDALAGVERDNLLAEVSVADLLFRALTGRAPRDGELLSLQMLTGILISNGPGAISAQGAKGAVAADGPQTPERVQINKAMVGFLSHSGFSHGGNGFEGIAFLLEQFGETGLADPSDPGHGLDLAAMATGFARSYKAEKARARELGTGTRALPGVHHPVFRGKAENFDPRERFIAGIMRDAGRYNVFHTFYLELVRALHREGASPYVFCVNVDAVIAAILLEILWDDHKSGRLASTDLECAAFTVFLYGRMIGAAAEIDDHLNRGRNMDTRTPASLCSHVV